MVQKVGKLEQYKLLNSSQINPLYIPATAEYSLENLHLFLTKFNVVYIKHATSGQGRGVFKLTKGKKQIHTLDGFSIHGKAINQELTIKQIHRQLQPFERLGRLSPYIIQEGIQSVTKSGQPFIIRVHVQCVKGDWQVSGMLGTISFGQLEKSGIVNRSRGSQNLSIQELLNHHLRLNPEEERGFLEKIRVVSIEVSKTIASEYPTREYGLDVGVDTNLNPKIFEVNTTPGIAGFYYVDQQIWHHIIENRKSR
ncbi:hypothetical protein BABA_04169 [Neobacillus bataviensis LMG 21833]|uniref:ATP-grasp domain-containing protein n=1 Tax=Neobacillus bataviensis LMG 21833 TaxID=1117379 RepID=K6DDL4_9BACI|nr:YheC/YheD family protein [Neobacillus bataviensis]EKN70607.1 hypothetical protein BABA_04169 [Neobacillus bataviensis LMG 21833]